MKKEKKKKERKRKKERKKSKKGKKEKKRKERHNDVWEQREPIDRKRRQEPPFKPFMRLLYPPLTSLK